MKKYVADGTVKAFELWNPANLGYLAAYAAVEYASGKINGTQGQTFTAGKLGTFTVGADKTVLLGPPLRLQRRQHQQLQLLTQPGCRGNGGLCAPGPARWGRGRAGKRTGSGDERRCVT